MRTPISIKKYRILVEFWENTEKLNLEIKEGKEHCMEEEKEELGIKKLKFKITPEAIRKIGILWTAERYILENDFEKILKMPYIEFLSYIAEMRDKLKLIQKDMKEIYFSIGANEELTKKAYKWQMIESDLEIVAWVKDEG